jgi:tetratricopeptide (TPR) repeat protein
MLDRSQDTAAPSSTASNRARLAARFAPLARPWFLCLLLVLIAVAVRSPSLPGERIWDDHYLSSANPLIKSPIFAVEVFRHYLFLDSFSTHYRPVQVLSYILDYVLWRDDPYGFHLSNLLWHAGSGVLLFLLVRELFAAWASRRSGDEQISRNLRNLPAFFVALLWAVHPVHSAAVDYIAGRADSLAFFFACAGWLLFIKAGKVRHAALSWSLYALAAFSGLLALCAREIAGIWFALFLLHLFCFQSQTRRRLKLCALVACLSLFAGYVGLRHLPQHRTDPPPSTGWSASVRGVLMLRALGDYGRLMVYPSNLHMERTIFHPGVYANRRSWREGVQVEYLSIAGLAVLAVFALGISRRGKARTVRIFGASWFFLAYLPISNVVELNATVAEHWLYLPSVGALIFLAGCALDCPVRYRRATVAFACLAAIGLSARSAVRSSDWVTEQGFYERTLAAGGVSARVGVNLALIYAQKKDLAKAETMFRKVLASAPDYPAARNSLGQILYDQGRREEANEVLGASVNAAAEARKDYPRTWTAALSLAKVKHADGDTAGALALLERARHEYPRTWEIISFQSELTRLTSGPAAAVALVEEFARANWWHYGAALALGQLYSNLNDLPRARAALRHASRLDVHDVQALNLLAFVDMNSNQFADACRTQRRALARQPDQPRQYLILSNILDKMGRGDESRAMLAHVTRMKAVADEQMAAN